MSLVKSGDAAVVPRAGAHGSPVAAARSARELARLHGELVEEHWGG